jgi:MYXO-CTERM domain-containing protein
MSLRRLAAAAAFFAASALPVAAHAEPTDPVVIGWWSYFDPVHYPTSTNPSYTVTYNGDPNDFYYEPSGARGMRDPTLPAATAWNTLVSFILSKTSSATLSSGFTIDETSSVSVCFCAAQYGWALGLLYVPKDKYCDTYRLHVGAVDDGVELLVNGTVVGNKTIAQNGDPSKEWLSLVDGAGKSILRPGINEVVVIHADDQQVQRYVHDVYLEHAGTQVPLAPKNIVYGRITDDAATPKPIYESTVQLKDAAGAVKDTFVTGPLGFYFFAGLPNGTWTVDAVAGGYKEGTTTGTTAGGTAAGEARRVDLALSPGCSCPSGKTCSSSGQCLDPCIRVGELGEGCADPSQTCVDHVCVKNACDTLVCKGGFHCQAGACVENACSNVCCGSGQICSAGACVANSCPAAGCGAGKVCAGGACVDACSTLTCLTGLTCKDGKCLDPCTADPSACSTADAGDTGIVIGDDTGVTIDDGAVADAGDAGGGGGGASGDSGSSCGCTVPGGAATTASGLFAAIALAMAGARRRKTRG